MENKCPDPDQLYNEELGGCGLEPICPILNETRCCADCQDKDACELSCFKEIN